MVEQEKKGRQQEKAVAPATPLAPVYVSTLQSFETCGYFDASYKRRKPTEKKSMKVVKLSDGRTVKIIPTVEYGYPNAIDLDYKRALFRIIDEQADWVERINPDGTKTRHPQVHLPIRAQAKPFIRYAGRIPHPNERKNLHDFLHRCRATTMLGEFADPKTRQFARADVALFAQIITQGEQTKDGLESEYHHIWLTPFALREYYFLRTRQEDHIFHQQLANPISKVLYPYLDSGWFAALSNGGTAYTKAYATLCEWIALTQYKTESEIKRQLDPTHRELHALGYLERWEYVRGKKEGYSVRWYPGRKWFADAKARGAEFTPPPLLTDPHPAVPPPRLTTPNPGPPPSLSSPPTTSPEAEALVRFFYTTFHGFAPATVAPRELTQAHQVIAAHGLACARYVVEYAHHTAMATKYQPQTFGGLLSFVPQAVADYAKRQAALLHQQQARAREEEQARQEEAQHRADEAVLAQLAPADYARLYAEVQAKVYAETPFFRQLGDGALSRSLIRHALVQHLRATTARA